MNTHNMFLWRNKKNINTFGPKKHLIKSYGINTIYQFIKPFLVNKMSFLEEYGAVNKVNLQLFYF